MALGGFAYLPSWLGTAVAHVAGPLPGLPRVLPSQEAKAAPRGCQAPTGVLAAAVAQPWHGSANTSSPAPSITELLPLSIFIYFFSF